MVALLRALAEYEQLLGRFHITAEIVRRDYFCERPPIHCDLLFEGERPAGVATWYWTYGSFAAARKIYLADLFVPPEFRGRHYGQALIGHLARRVLDEGGIGIDWRCWIGTAVDRFLRRAGRERDPQLERLSSGGEALARAAKA